MNIVDPNYSPDQISQILARRAEALAQPLPEETEGQAWELLIFRLGTQLYAINMADVLEIYPMPQITAVPRTPDFVLGIFSARGRFLSVVSLPILLGHPSTPISNHGQAVVVGINDLQLAFLVDNIEGSERWYEHELQPPLAATFTLGLTPTFTAVLDLHTLLNRQQLIIDEELADE